MNIKYILCILGGFAGGAVAGKLYTEHKMKETMDDFKKVQERHKKTYEQMLDKIRKERKEIDIENTDEYKDMMEERDFYRAAYESLYNKRMKTYESKSEDPEEPVTLAPQEDPLSELGAYAITVSDFMDDVKYEKVYCEYYRETESLVDTKTESEMDIQEALGEMWELLSGYTGRELYIRNTRTGTDYQIDFLPGVFGDGGD